MNILEEKNYTLVICQVKTKDTLLRITLTILIFFLDKVEQFLDIKLKLHILSNHFVEILKQYHTFICDMRLLLPHACVMHDLTTSVDTTHACICRV